jgi:hypothetical protein
MRILPADTAAYNSLSVVTRCVSSLPSTEDYLEELVEMRTSNFFSAVRYSRIRLGEAEIPVTGLEAMPDSAGAHCVPISKTSWLMLFPEIMAV